MTYQDFPGNVGQPRGSLRITRFFFVVIARVEYFAGAQGNQIVPQSSAPTRRIAARVERLAPERQSPALLCSVCGPVWGPSSARSVLPTPLLRRPSGLDSTKALKSRTPLRSDLREPFPPALGAASRTSLAPDPWHRRTRSPERADRSHAGGADSMLRSVAVGLACCLASSRGPSANLL